ICHWSVQPSPTLVASAAPAAPITISTSSLHSAATSQQHAQKMDVKDTTITDNHGLAAKINLEMLSHLPRTVPNSWLVHALGCHPIPTIKLSGFVQ
ncbi:MAG: hypothetical protein ACRYGG_06105, partial [Janthinobacterium lividum]